MKPPRQLFCGNKNSHWRFIRAALPARAFSLPLLHPHTLRLPRFFSLRIILTPLSPLKPTTNARRRCLYHRQLGPRESPLFTLALVRTSGPTFNYPPQEGKKRAFFLRSLIWRFFALREKSRSLSAVASSI
jgi:hypothetical protein